MQKLSDIYDLADKNSANKKDKNLSIFQPNQKLMFVGQIHGKKAVISSEIENAIKKYGAWYEGNGDDKIDGVKYQGSWDDALAKDVHGYPKEYLFVIFTNTEVNNQKDIFQGNDSIFNRILKTQNKFGYFKKRKFSPETLVSFLNEMGNDYLQKSKMKATKENVASFVNDGEKEMWESGNTKASKMAEKANKYRDKWLLKQPEGVYFVGSDHLKELKTLKEKNND